VLLELLLSSSAEPVRAPLSLGHVGARPEPREYVLNFAMPEFPSIPDFDEVTVRFHMQSRRETESARIAIRYLVLIPRTVQ
jgi:hypothetical protein